jgi:hypothetical protein
MQVDVAAPPPEDVAATTPPPGAGPASPASTVADVDMGADNSDEDDVHVTLHVNHGLISTEDDEDVKPDVSALEAAGEPWLMDELLEAATCCLYCGGRFALAL